MTLWFKGTGVTRVYPAVTSSVPAGNLSSSRVIGFYGTFTMPTQGTTVPLVTDRILMAELPGGCIVTSLSLVYAAWTTGTTLTASVGLVKDDPSSVGAFTDEDVDCYISGIDSKTAGSVILTGGTATVNLAPLTGRRWIAVSFTTVTSGTDYIDGAVLRIAGTAICPGGSD